MTNPGDILTVYISTTAVQTLDWFWLMLELSTATDARGHFGVASSGFFSAHHSSISANWKSVTTDHVADTNHVINWSETKVNHEPR